MSECIDHGKKGNKSGYASCWWQGEYTNEHRKAYCIANNLTLADIKGKVVRHKCDNPRCKNGEHLLIGSASDNMKDAVNRGRHSNNLRNHAQTANRRRGEEQANAVLTEEIVLDIRKRCREKQTQVSVAKLYGIRQTDVSRIVNYKAWSHVA